MLEMKVYDALATVEKAFEYTKWCKEIPYINFPQSWEIQMIPPFLGAVVRFRVRDNHGREVSVYLDCYEVLGRFGGEPYWEMYPAYDGDIARFAMQDTEALIKEIAKCFAREAEE
ncbi:MAG: hypothetical protein WC138_13700 [Methanoculleus sp.]